MAHRVTRPSNANAHPRMVDRNPLRCTREELQAEREAKVAAIAQAEPQRPKKEQVSTDLLQLKGLIGIR